MDKKDYFRDTDEGWIMQQILLDNLALGEGIPLRIIKLEELIDLYKNFSKAATEAVKLAKKISAKTITEVTAKAVKDAENLNDKFGVFFSNEESFKSFSSHIVDWFLEKPIDLDDGEVSERLEVLSKLYNDFSHKIFPVLPSNLHSLEFLSQTIIKYWRIYALLWLYKKLGLDKAAIFDESQPTLLEQVYGFDSFRAMCKIVKIKREGGHDNRILILAGPVFEVEIGALTNETGVDGAVIDKAESLLNRLVHRTADPNHNNVHYYSGSYFRQAIHLETVRQTMFLSERFYNVLHIWNLLYSAFIAVDTKISHKYLRMLTVWAQHVDKITQDDRVSEINKILLTSDNLYGKNLRSTELLAIKKNGTWCIEMRALDAASASESSHQREKFYGLYTLLERKTKQLDKSRLIVLGLWLDSQFSALLHSSGNVSPDENNVRYRLAAWICAALRADIAEIHSYYPERGDQLLQVHEMFIHDKNYHIHRNATIEGLHTFSKEKRRLSNIYQALLTGRERICLDREGALAPKDDAHPSLCKIEISQTDACKDWPPENAEMVVPINFNGRVIGATRVASLGRWRFRWGQRMLLLNIATNLGAYWYQQRHLGCLSEIQKQVLAFNQSVNRGGGDPTTLYDAICNQAAVLFLCKGAGLWLRNNTNRDQFIREGRHGVEVAQKIQSVKAGKTFISYTVAYTVEEAKKDKAVPLICEHVETSKRICVQNKLSLRASGIEYVAHIPIRDKDDEVIAVLALYDSSNRGFDESWRFIAQFFAGHLRVILESVTVFIRDRESRKHIMVHEISNSVSFLVDNAAKIAKPITTQVATLKQLHTALCAPQVVNRLNVAKMMGEIPRNTDICSELHEIINSLSDCSDQSLAGIDEHASKLRNLLNTLSARFLAGDVSTSISKVYAKEPERIPQLVQKARDILMKTDSEFVRLIIGARLLDENVRPVNLSKEIKEITKTAGHTPFDDSDVNESVEVNINRSALNAVLTNLWSNARKYRKNEFDLISWSIEPFLDGGCKLIISNPSIHYSSEEIDKLKSYGYQHPSWRLIKREEGSYEGYNQGLGLYLVDNLCKHVLNISFDVDQNVYADGRSDFICELIFNPNLVITGIKHGQC